MKLKVNKLPIVIPLALVAVLLITLAVTSMTGLDSAKKHTNLGQKHLDDGEYASAITEFLQSLSMDPTGEEARIGLARAYIATDGAEEADEILQPLLDAGNPEAYRLLVESRKENDPMGALAAAQMLVNRTDDEEDQKILDQLLAQMLTESHEYAEGTDQTLMVSGGKVYSRGSNALGQLGVETDIGVNSSTETMSDAGFPGEAAGVYCAGRTSLVIDKAGDVWAAGENRWGQYGTGDLLLGQTAGWTKIAENAVSVAGNAGAVYVLKKDGTLWYSGQGEITSPELVKSVGQVVSIASIPGQIAALSADGKLYLNSYGTPNSFTVQADDVKCFSLTPASGLMWVTNSNEINGSFSYYYSIPSSWEGGETGPRPDFPVVDIADGYGTMFLLNKNGELMSVGINSGDVKLVDKGVESIYPVPGSAVIHYADGTSARWDSAGMTVEPLA